MWICHKKTWKTTFCVAVFLACFVSPVQSAAGWVSQYFTHNSGSDVAEKASEAANKAASGASEKTSEAVNKAADVAEKASEAANKAASGVSEKASEAVNKAADVAEKASEAANKAASGVSKKASEAVNKAADVPEKASEAVNKAASGVSKKASEAVNKAADVAEKASEAANKAASGVSKKASEAVNKAADVAEKASEAANKAASGASKKASEAVNKAADVPEKASEAVNKAASGVSKKASEAVNKAADVAEKASEAANKAASGVSKKASEAVNKAADVAEKASMDLSFKGMTQSRKFILENQQALFKDYDLDKLLHNIRVVLEHNNLKNIQKQFHRLFDKKDSSVYSCVFENASLDEKPAVKKEVVEHSRKDGESDVANVENHDHKSRLQEIRDHLKKTGEYLKTMYKDAEKTEDRLQKADNLLEKTHKESDHVKPYQDNDFPLLSSKELYKKGYDFILSANYIDAEKAFCAFQQRYKKDPLSDDALFWLAEALLGQKRYHEAAQVYLAAWYADKERLYTSEILLKLARSMVALEQNKEACTFFAKKSKHSKTLESVFCKSFKRSGIVRGVR